YYTSPGPDKEFCELMEKFIDNFFSENKKEDAKTDCENIIKKIKELAVRPLQSFLLLKHRIVHLFLPLDIDLQGIAEVKEKNNEKVVAYLKEVLEEHKNNQNYYQQKLADLWYMVARKENGKSEKKLLANGQAIIDLISEQLKKSEVKDQQQDCKGDWKELLKHCGLKYNGDDPLDPSKIQPDENSEIFKFMCKLDECVTNQKCDNIDEILKFDKTSEIFFHKWFCALDECLDKLRDILKKYK
ncbi:MAG: hypothetical protein ACUVQP_07075, partial [Bacteroidales bacterium]